MGNQNKYLLIYLCILCLVVGSVVQLAQADEQNELSTEEASTELDQAVVDQMLAPIALYPDTLLSHILVASTYPLEVIQAARWRKANESLDAEKALDYAETQDWDPSVQALVPFTDLLQTLSDDLQWLQQLGDAFLFNEEQVLSSIQGLRQKAYALGNLNDNEYLNVDQQDNEIIIQPVQKEIVYVPYYDTRVVYGGWWWHDRQPHRWRRPHHSILTGGFYWSIGFHIRPSFYFGGFFWPKRHLFADYSYRRNSTKHWSNHKTKSQKVKSKESQRWAHNTKHRRGVQYHKNGQRVVFVNNGKSGHTAIVQDNKGVNKSNKKRVLKYGNDSKNQKLNSKRVKNALNTKSSQQERSKNYAKSKYEAQHKKNNVKQTNNKQNKNNQNQFSTEKKQTKPQQVVTNKANKVDKSQSKAASYHHQNQAKSTKQSNKARATNSGSKQTYRGNNSKSNKQNYQKQNKSRTVKVSRQSYNQNKR